MDDETNASVSQQVRAALSNGSALTVAEIFERCKDLPSTSVIATALWSEVAANRVTRTGERMKYRYALTKTGQAAADNPRLLRGRSRRRRPDGIRPPPPQRTTSTASRGRPPAEAAAIIAKINGETRGAPAAAIVADERESLHIPSGEVTRGPATDRDPSTDSDTQMHPARRLAAAILLFWPADASIPGPLRRQIFESIESGNAP